MSAWQLKRWNYRRLPRKARRELFRDVKRAMGTHDVYNLLARFPSLLRPRNASRTSEP
jgi:hypothetical protein